MWNKMSRGQQAAARELRDALNAASADGSAA